MFNILNREDPQKEIGRSDAITDSRGTPTTSSHAFSHKREPKRFVSRLIEITNALAAVFIVGVLLSGYILLFRIHRSTTGGYGPPPPTVLTSAHLVVSPATLDFGKLPQGVKAALAVAISNTGGQRLSWTADTGSASWLSVETSTAAIEPGSPDQKTISQRA